jgi:hypothetical protein
MVMIGDYKVISVTPAGRRRYVAILARYLLKERGLIDHHEWWVNTGSEEDIAFLHEITRRHSDFFRIVTTPAGSGAGDPNSGSSSNDLVVEIAYLPSLVDKLINKSDPVSTFLGGQLNKRTAALLAEYRAKGSRPKILKLALLKDLHNVIHGPLIYDSTRFNGIALRPETSKLLAKKVGGRNVAQLNRLLMEDAYPLELSRNSCYRICEWFPRTTATDSIYVRFDDDIVYMAPGAVETLLRFRIGNPFPFLVYPCIVNNSIMSHLLQRRGAIPTDIGLCEYDLYGRGWKDNSFAEGVHRHFLNALRTDGHHRWRFDPWVLFFYERVSINCISWFGRDFGQFAGRVSMDEEQFLSSDKPAQLQRPNVICGNSLVAHFSYSMQNAHMDQTDLLSEYGSLADSLPVL